MNQNIAQINILLGKETAKKGIEMDYHDDTKLNRKRLIKVRNATNN